MLLLVTFCGRKVIETDILLKINWNLHFCELTKTFYEHLNNFISSKFKKLFRMGLLVVG